MDTVFFIIKGHEVYVGDYYKGEVKQVKFKDKDYWEVFDQHDFREFIEHMNYPLNYKNFKGNPIKILYSEPQKYEMLFKLQEDFKEALSVDVGMLPSALLKWWQAQGIEGQDTYRIMYEQSCYSISQVGEGKYTIQLLEEVDEDLNIQEVTTLDLCQFLLEEERLLTPLGERWAVLSPVTLEEEIQVVDKEKYLETHHKINKETMIGDGASVECGSIIFDYTKSVRKLFGGHATQILQKKSEQAGIFFDLRDKKTQQKEHRLWAQKDELIGVVGKEGDTVEDLKWWLEKIGF